MSQAVRPFSVNDRRVPHVEASVSYEEYNKWSREPAEKRRWTEALEKWGPKRVEVGLSDRAPRFVPGVRRGRLPEKEFRLEDHQQRYLREHTSGITRNLVHGRSASDPPHFKQTSRPTTFG